LVEFCMKGDLEEVKDALKRCVNINTKGEKGWTGLMWAVRNSHNSVVELLLKTPNIDVNIVNNYGHTALHCAVIVNNIEGLKLLHSHPSLTALTLNQKDKNFGATPVMWAVRSGELEQLALLAADPRVDLDTIVVDDDSWSMLHWAVRNDTIEAVKLLLNISRLDVNIVNNIGETALHWAVKFSKKLRL